MSALATFTRLSLSVLLYDPPATTPRPPTAPSTILLCTWLDASPRHAAKYTSTYVSLFPSSRIILVTCDSTDFTWRPAERIAPALNALLALPSGDDILVHTFSNGGCHQLLHLAALYRGKTGRSLPIRGVVLDSCPGTGDLLRAYYGFATSLNVLPWWKRWVAKFGTFMNFVMLGLVYRALGKRNVIQDIRHGLNDEQLVRREARRAYVFGEGDTVVGAKDIKEHAVEAEQLGYNVKKERFDGTAHVAHVRGGEQRYWEIVEDAWTGEGWENK